MEMQTPARSGLSLGATVRPWWVAVVLVALPPLISFAALSPYFAAPFSDNEGIFGAVALGLSHGSSLYTEVWDHKPPLIFVLYRFVRVIFGESDLGLHMAAWAVHCLTAFSLYRLMQKLGSGFEAAWLTACLYSAFLFSSWLQPWTLQAEVLQLPLMAESILLALNPSRARLILAGSLWACAFFIKQNAITMLPLFPIMWRREEGKWRHFSTFLIGVNLTALTIVTPFAVSGRMQEFWIAVSAYNLHGYLPSGWKTLDAPRQASWSAWGNHMAQDFSGIATALAIWLLTARYQTQSRAAGILAVWLVLAITACFVSGFGHGYYFLSILAPLAGLAALALASLPGRAFVFYCLLAIILVPFLLRATFESKAGAGQTVLERQYGTPRFNHAKELGLAIRAQKNPDDGLLVWSRDAQIYAYAGIKPQAARTVLIAHTHFLPGELGRFEERLTAAPPRFIVVSDEMNRILEMPPWLQEILKNKYEANAKVGNVDPTTLYRLRRP